MSEYNIFVCIFASENSILRALHSIDVQFCWHSCIEYLIPLHLVAGCVLSCKSCPLFTSTNFLLSCQKFLLLHNMSSLQSFVQILRTIIQILEFSCLLFCLLQFLTKKRPTYPITYLPPLEKRSNPWDLWPLRHLIRVMRRHDLTKKFLCWNWSCKCHMVGSF